MELLTVKQIALWVHLLSILGCFGMVLASSISARSHTPETLAKDKTLSFSAIAAGVGLVAGLIVFLLKTHLSSDLPNTFMMFIAIKLMLLIVAGGALAGASKKARQGDAKGGNVGRSVALASIALAALLGVFLSPTP